MKKINLCYLPLLLLSPTVAVAYGSSFINIQLGAYHESVAQDDSGSFLTGRFGIGYLWDISPNFRVGAEIGLNGFSDIETTVMVDDPVFDDFPLDILVQRFIIDALAVFELSMNPCWDLFAKAGVAHVKQEYFAGDYYYDYGYLFEPYYLNPGSHTANVPKVALGIGYNIDDRLNMNLSFEREFADNHDYVNNSVSAANSVKFGLRISFF